MLEKKDNEYRDRNSLKRLKCIKLMPHPSCRLDGSGEGSSPGSEGGPVLGPYPGGAKKTEPGKGPNMVS